MLLTRKRFEARMKIGQDIREKQEKQNRKEQEILQRMIQQVEEREQRELERKQQEKIRRNKELLEFKIEHVYYFNLGKASFQTKRARKGCCAGSFGKIN